MFSLYVVHMFLSVYKSAKSGPWVRGQRAVCLRGGVNSSPGIVGGLCFLENRVERAFSAIFTQ